MSLKFNEFLAVVYSDLFEYPLTREQAKLWRVTGGFLPIKAALVNKNLVQNKNGYYFLPGREKLIRLRQEREKFSQAKEIKALAVTKLIKTVPTVQAVFLTGSVAAGNAKEEADIDLMIITQPGAVWMTRLIVVTVLKLAGSYRSNLPNCSNKNKICPNIFLDTEHLEIKEQNLYAAHEVLQAKCLFDRGGVEKKWLEENGWTKEFSPEAYLLKIKNLNFENSFPIKNCKFQILTPLEWLAFKLQYLHMKSKITNERVSRSSAFFHPRDLSKEIMNRFQRRLKKLAGKGFVLFSD